VKERVGTIIIAAEGKAMLNARIAAALIELGVEEKEVPIAWVKQVPDFNTKDGVTKLARELRAVSEHFRAKFGVRLGFVFVDTVSASFDIKEEADNAEAARVCKVMRRIGEATGAIVVPIHHYGKNAGVGLRGASAWRANADFVLSVMADIDPQTGDVSNRQLAIAKDRDGSQGPLTPFMLKWVEIGVDDSGSPWGTMVAVAEPSSVKPASHWPPGLSVFRQALLAALIDSGFEDRPFVDGPALQVADIKWVKSEFAKVCHVDSETEEGRQEALRKQFTRKLNDAQQKKLVGVRVASDRTLIWLVKAGD
jgi:AAA domain